MVLTNYWWLLVWIFLAGALFSLFPRQKIVISGKREYRWGFVPAVFSSTPVYFVGGI